MHHSQFLAGLLIAAAHVARGQVNPDQAPQPPQTPNQQSPNQNVGPLGQTPSIDNDDVPPECRNVCQPVIQLSNRCDNQFDNDDNDGDDDDINANQQNVNNQQPGQNQRDCVCNDQNARQALEECGQCVQRYPQFFQDRDVDDGIVTVSIDENEVNTWLRTCSFQQSGPNVTDTTDDDPTITPGPSATGTSTVTDQFDSTETSTATDQFDSTETSTATDQFDSTQTSTDSVTQFTGAAAVATAMPYIGAGAGIVLAAMAF